MTKQATAAKANDALNAIYEKQTGLTSGPVIKALNAMNKELGLTDPFCIPVQNLYKNDYENIPPGGFGVVKAGRLTKRLKRLTITTKEASDES